MAINLKQNGIWHELGDLGQTNISNFEIQPSDWEENVQSLNYVASVDILGMTSTYSAIVLFDSGQDGLEITATCAAGAIYFYCASVPTKALSGNIIYSCSGQKTKIYYVGGLSAEDARQVEDQVIQRLPISVVKDGNAEYVQIEKMRQLTNAVFSRNGQNITINYTLEGGIEMQDSILLDVNDRPQSGVSNGVAWEISWNGF